MTNAMKELNELDYMRLDGAEGVKRLDGPGVPPMPSEQEQRDTAELQRPRMREPARDLNQFETAAGVNRYITQLERALAQAQADLAAAKDRYIEADVRADLKRRMYESERAAREAAERDLQRMAGHKADRCACVFDETEELVLECDYHKPIRERAEAAERERNVLQVCLGTGMDPPTMDWSADNVRNAAIRASQLLKRAEAAERMVTQRTNSNLVKEGKS